MRVRLALRIAIHESTPSALPSTRYSPRATLHMPSPAHATLRHATSIAPHTPRRRPPPVLPCTAHRPPSLPRYHPTAVATRAPPHPSAGAPSPPAQVCPPVLGEGLRRLMRSHNLEYVGLDQVASPASLPPSPSPLTFPPRPHPRRCPHRPLSSPGRRACGRPDRQLRWRAGARGPRWLGGRLAVARRGDGVQGEG